ncbi:Thiosulphate-binding protein [Rivularia sp. IAM M-261]|nr:Thiosulphate-binding protein [Calothrix sp. PCC 7716]GJD19661.1 Thiosulphate-binding protein [Rivularia sp. IAM M-261]
MPQHTPGIFGALLQRSNKTFALFAAAGLGISLAIPVFAASTVGSGNAPVAQKNQLIAQRGGRVEITLVSYAVTKAAYDKIIPDFKAQWKKQTGQDVEIKTSYGGSGTQTRAIIDGLQADVINLALGLDVNRIQQSGLIQPGWERELPNNGIVTRSVIAFETREGNPKRIQGWKDLTRRDVKVITANPKTSGVARWNFLGLWGSVINTGGNLAAAREYVTQVYRNVPVLPKDAREASDAFYKKNQGDVLLNYENEVILAGKQGKTSPSYIVPQVNISIDAPVAVVDKVVDKRGTRKVAEAFAKFLYTPQAQREFASVGFRPVNATVAREYQKQFPRVATLKTVADFGGWENVQKRFFADGAIFDQIYTRR